MLGDTFRMIRMPALAFVGGFLVIGAWKFAPAMSGYLPSGSVSSWFSEPARLGRPETSPVVRICVQSFLSIAPVPPGAKIEPSQVYSILKTGSMASNVATMAGQPGGLGTAGELASLWGHLANCIYGQEDRALCDPDNRAAAVESTAKFFGYAKQVNFLTSKPSRRARDVISLETLNDRLSQFLKNHKSYGTLVAADFGNFAPPEVMQIMGGEKATRNICKR